MTQKRVQTESLTKAIVAFEGMMLEDELSVHQSVAFGHGWESKCP